MIGTSSPSSSSKSSGPEKPSAEPALADSRSGACNCFLGLRVLEVVMLILHQYLAPECEIVYCDVLTRCRSVQKPRRAAYIPLDRTLPLLARLFPALPEPESGVRACAGLPHAVANASRSSAGPRWLSFHLIPAP